MITITVNPEGVLPPFEQIRVQIVDAVRGERLAAGAKLPTVRALAADLDLAVNTVAKAYKALEADGVIETRGRAGTFVAALGDPAERRAKTAAADYATLVDRLGLSADEALAYIRAALGR
ncbi:GntR family transcriptional regulator [Agromyces seonyuensis]|uniref:GntR family transcriptional regulator n=1 Tax=Agromyces seonyuensis TaxID=2662446 RepID=A0A6I4NUI9_9MICO|nr:GntR family transcriptional regulator [Agromyces seonyuensis]MWB97950.1 GntR family transcriptional regulator [Agromyces seonyuensis]